MIKYCLILLVAIIPASAQTPEGVAEGIEIWTDGFYHDRQTTITVWGHTTHMAPVTILVLNPAGNIVAVDQTETRDGMFSIDLYISGPYWRHDGVYTITARAGTNTTPYATHIGVGETDCDGTYLDAGNDGLYCIMTDNVSELYIDKQNSTMEIHGEGQVMIQIPRGILDSKDGDMDKPFVVYYQDGMLHHEEASDGMMRMIQFEHPGGIVTILGTHAIPEFGTILLVMAACSVAVVAYRVYSPSSVLQGQGPY